MGMLFVLILVAVVGIMVYKSMRAKEIFQCSSCNTLMSRAHFANNGNKCVKCNSDIVRRTGEKKEKI